jgi:hypothetical protein
MISYHLLIGLSSITGFLGLVIGLWIGHMIKESKIVSQLTMELKEEIQRSKMETEAMKKLRIKYLK